MHSNMTSRADVGLESLRYHQLRESSIILDEVAYVSNLLELEVSE